MNFYDILMWCAAIAVVVAFIASPFMAIYEAVKERRNLAEEIKKQPLAYVFIPIVILVGVIGAILYAVSQYNY